MAPKPKSQNKESYHQKRKARGDRQISLWLSAEEFQEVEELRQTKGLSLKELFFQSIQAGRKAKAQPHPHQEDETQDALLLTESLRGELFVFNGKKEYVLATIVLDRDQLPEWHPLEISFIKDVEHAEIAIQYFCQNPKKFPKFAQTVLLHRADEGHLGFKPANHHWYYVAHILFEVYPRQMNAYGDFETYNKLLEHWMLK